MSEAQFAKLVSTALKAGGADNGRSSIEVERALDVLKQLESFEVSTQLLRKTNGGKQVRKLCKSSVDLISTAAKAVIKQWKAQISAEDDQSEKAFAKRGILGRSDSGSVATFDRASPRHSEGLTGVHSAQDVSSLNQRETSSTELIRSSSVSFRGNTGGQLQTEDRTRTLARSKFEELLATEAAKMTNAVLDKQTAAAEIETAIHEQNGSSLDKSYKEKFRTLLFNLKDQKNSLLRQRILRREISAVQLVKMSSEELANDEKKRENDDIRKNKLRECERGVSQGATTDAFTCGKCKANKCTYYQLQTRSADEPMTTYVTCTQCGNRWKC